MHASTLDNRKELPSRQMVSEVVPRHMASKSLQRRCIICSLLSPFPASPGASFDLTFAFFDGRLLALPLPLPPGALHTTGASSFAARLPRFFAAAPAAGAFPAALCAVRARVRGGAGFSTDEDEPEETAPPVSSACLAASSVEDGRPDGPRISSAILLQALLSIWPVRLQTVTQSFAANLIRMMTTKMRLSTLDTGSMFI